MVSSKLMDLRLEFDQLHRRLKRERNGDKRDRLLNAMMKLAHEAHSLVAHRAANIPSADLRLFDRVQRLSAANRPGAATNLH